MMVTFVSQCQHKALNRTRRVLDAFANRIGSRTWQTVITDEGLQAVKKLLRKSATKNTVVSCHWIRSRSRSEFIWVVGRKNEFNAQGFVSVNYTNQDVFLGEITMEKQYANTKQQPLDQHLFSVGYVAHQICKQLVDDDKLAQAVFVAGCWHDMGKVDPGFQQWILKKTKKQVINDIPEDGQHIDTKSDPFSFEKHPRHNEISLLLYHLLNDESDKSINKANKNLIKHSIYWHHAKPIRKEEIKKLEGVYKKLRAKLKDKSLNGIEQIIYVTVKSINNLSENYTNFSITVDGILKTANEDRLSELREKELSAYKTYADNSDEIIDFVDDIRINAKNNIARTAVITADRLVSALSAEQLNQHVEESSLDELLKSALLTDRGLKTEIQTCLQGFETNYPNSDRSKQQQKAAHELSDAEVSVGVLSGAAGCGKTKIALEWATNTNARKIIWICPRVQVCQGLVNDLISAEYLPKAKIEICTGEFKTIYQHGEELDTPENQEFSGDIVLTTIDQVINTITTHTKITGLVQYMNAHVVFDEYHEYINMPAFNLLFAELVECKKMQGKKANALLVSATPNYYFVDELLGINKSDIIGIESFNKSQYKIEFTNFEEGEEDNNPLYQAQPDNTIVISNTAITAQKSFTNNQMNETALLFHSKYKKLDKQTLFKKVFNTFKKEGSKEYAVLRSGPIVQASLNITCDKMITEFTHAENWLQRMGRLDRFGDNTQANVYITATPETLANGKQSGACARFLNQSHCLQSAKAWYEFLKDKITDNPLLSIAEVYQIYQEFYDNDKNREAVGQDLLTALKKSVDVINAKVMDPVSFPSKNKPKDGKPKIKKNSLRGDNRFVQMAVMNIDDGKEKFPNEYAYDESDDQGNLTMGVEIICGYGDSEKDLLAFMAKKHHNIKEQAKKAYKDNVLLGEARMPETPVYLSYTPEDLKQVEAQANPYAIYYAIGKNQPIGAISLEKIQK